MRLKFLALLLLSLPAVAQTPNASDSASWRKDLLQWRETYTKSLLKEDGWFSVVGLSWLKPGDNTMGSTAADHVQLPTTAGVEFGTLHLSGNAVVLQPPQGGFPQALAINGTHPNKTVSLMPDIDPNPSKLTAGTLFITIIRRGDRFGVRIKDSAAPARKNFHGLHWYEPDANYRIHAKWIPYATPQLRAVPTIIGTDDRMSAPGVAEFTLNGQTLRLEPVLEKPNDKQLFFILRDTTSKTETYGAGRFLYADLPSNGLTQPGELWLDFNRLHNPPCAFTAYATCPLPLPSNRLQVALPAGEKRYHD